MKSIGSSKQLLIITGILFLAALSLYVLFAFHINGKKDSTAAVYTEIDILQNQSDQLQDLNKLSAEVDENQEKLNSYFVQTENIIEFLESIEQIGDDSGAEIEVRSINEEEGSSDEVGVLTLNLTAKGSWESIYHFLVLIENFPIKSTFDRIQMSRVGDDDEEVLEWRGVVNMKVLELKS